MPDTQEEIVSPTTGTRFELTLDSIYLYAKQIYLWNDVLPSYQDFAPRQKYSSVHPEITAFKKELFDLSQLKLNTETGIPYEALGFNNNPKYSYLQSGISKSGTLQAGFVLSEAIPFNEIIQSADKTIGYIALSSFPRLKDAQQMLIKAFEEVALAKPKYLVLDLRYNGGGYVETAEYVANLIVPSKLNGKVMYSEQFNSTLQAGDGKILRHQAYLDESGKAVLYKGRAATLADVDYSEKGNTYYFDKKGNLESVEEIYVIVSGQTASASELIISCLKPYFNIKLVGEKTYGKPVGFFGVNIDQYTVYLSSFLIKNAQGWSDYFNGMEPNISVALPANPILGDSEEPCLKAIISAINGSVKLASKAKLADISKGKARQQLSIINDNGGVGMIESRLRLK
ncbi:S41 family peptidase [Pedobacter sp. N23S346]|uniref:S41 family peptidase n=1 Tax=Pedobacter sp. N23S346 TaxID=3402750 RepID=UPI003AC6C3EF